MIVSQSTWSVQVGGELVSLAGLKGGAFLFCLNIYFVYTSYFYIACVSSKLTEMPRPYVYHTARET